MVSFASISTTTNALTFIILDLAARPEYIQPLRDEIEEVIAQEDVEEDENGILRFKQSSLIKLWKSDSFMKGVQGCLKTRNLEGSSLCFRCEIGTDVSPVTNSFSGINPPENKPSYEFDGFRFYRLRKLAGKEKKHLFVGVSSDSLTWGYGRDSCPSSFFADTEMKVILIELLRKWGLRVADPVKTNTETVRKVRELSIVAFKTAEMELRRRKM
ncbi:hypothetical protein NHQ30_004515 [Ciborinia camelliae]|nr:hypothetical protein NHQ30_004515 [Ciborinia camelliae]